MRFELTPASTAVPSPPESDDITTIPLRLSKKLASWNSIMLDFSE